MLNTMISGASSLIGQDLLSEPHSSDMGKSAFMEIQHQSGLHGGGGGHGGSVTTPGLAGGRFRYTFIL